MLDISEERIETLLHLLRLKKLTSDQKQELEEYCLLRPSLRDVIARLDDDELVRQDLSSLEQFDVEASLVGARAKLEIRLADRRRGWKVILSPGRMVAAAAIVTGVIIGSIYLFSSFDGNRSKGLAAGIQQPVKSHVSLVLPDGTDIDLDSMNRKGNVQRSGMVINKINSNELNITTAATRAVEASDAILNVPAGRQFAIRLPDGTRVWLNNVSSCWFPSAFTGPRRKVKIAGEAYMEIAKHPEQPFIAQVGEGDADLNILVLGTSFNISAYADESCIHTTVVDGKVQVSTKDHSELLIQNEQLTTGPNNIWQPKKTVNAATVIAWRNGILRSDGDSLTQVLRALARWYNKEFDIPLTLGQKVFKGELSRSMTIDQALDYVSGHGTTFKYSLTGNKIIISL